MSILLYIASSVLALLNFSCNVYTEQLLVSGDNHYHTKLSKEFHRDIRWWLRFLRTYNGVSVIPLFLWSTTDGIFSTDACLTGCGGLTSSQFFHCEFPSAMEAVAILAACSSWGSS